MPESMVAPSGASGARYTSFARQGHAQHDTERGIGEETLEVRAIEITGSNIGDAPILPELVDQIGTDQDIALVTADGLTAPGSATKLFLPEMLTLSSRHRRTPCLEADESRCRRT